MRTEAHRRNRLSLAGAVGLAAVLLAGAWLGLGSQPTRKPATRLGVQGTSFTLNGKPTFLYGISYYGALGAPDETIRHDLADIQKYGFNWIRVWATWSAFGNDVSAVDGDGKPRDGYLKKLQALVAECDTRGMVVDVTLSRGNGVTGRPRLQSLEAHRRAVETIVTALKAHRNWYLDLGNERSVKDKRFVSFEHLEDLRALARKLDPDLLVTASHHGVDLTRDDLRAYLQTARVDFISPHRPRNAGSPKQTEAQTLEYLAWMKDLGREVPVHYQEPFRRAYGKWEAKAEDFVTDYKGARAGGAAGWCFHNGDTRAARDGKPRRSFDLRDKRLFEQLDGEELRALSLLKASAEAYFPPPESKGGWRKLDRPDDVRRLAGMDPERLAELEQWLLASDKRNFAAVVIRNGHIVLEVERGNSAKTDSRRVASVSKAVCATVLAIAADSSRHGGTPRKMTFDDPAFDFLPWARPLSDPRKARITVKQLLNHTSGLCPEAVGAPNDGTWEYVLGHSGDKRTEKLAFDPGTACGYSTHAFHHAALVCETVTGKPYDAFAIEALFKPIGVEHWWFQFYEGGKKVGKHPSHGLGMPARDLARIAYCMLRGGRWRDRQVIPKWFVDETAAPTHDVKTPEMRFKRNAQSFSHGWELPALLTGEGGPSGKGIPKDARYKPGSGGQLIAFVPSLDLVVVRQTGASGAWEYEEYLRRACAAIRPAP